MRRQHLISIFGIIWFIFISCSPNGLPGGSDQVTQNSNTLPDTSGQSGTSVEPDPNMAPRAYVGLVVTADNSLLSELGNTALDWGRYHPRLYYPQFIAGLQQEWRGLLGAAVYDDQENIIIWQLTPHDYELFYRGSHNDGNPNYNFEFYALNQPQRLFVRNFTDNPDTAHLDTADDFYNPDTNSDTALAGTMQIGSQTPAYSASGVLNAQTAKLTSEGRTLLDTTGTYPLDLKDPTAAAVGDVYGPINPADRIVFTPTDHIPDGPSTEYTLEIRIVDGYEIWPGKFDFFLKNHLYFVSVPNEHHPPAGYTESGYIHTLRIPLGGPFYSAFDVTSDNQGLDMSYLALTGTFGRAHGEFAISDPRLGGSFKWGNFERPGSIIDTTDTGLGVGGSGHTIHSMILVWDDGDPGPDLSTIYEVFGPAGYPMDIPQTRAGLGGLGTVYESTDPTVYIHYSLGDRASHPSFPYRSFTFKLEIELAAK